jgi:hypothetical protein
MSVRLLSPPDRPVRPAPYGSRPPGRADGPPDGWQILNQSRFESLVVAGDRALLRASDHLARRISRRTLLKRLAQTGVVIGVAGSRLVWGPDYGLATPRCNVCDPNERNPGACGPSEQCGNLECSGTGDGRCNLSHSCNGRSVEGRVWGRASCTTNQGGTWQECCQNRVWICRDCCGCQVHSSGQCNTGNCSSGTRYKCICEKNTGNFCNPDPNQNPGC